MDTLVGWLFAIGFLIGMQALVTLACERTPALKAWRPALVGLALFWWLMPVIKKLYVDNWFYPDDSVVHEEIAREIAYLIRHQDWQLAWGYFGFGNDGYRFALGIFYALTRAPEITTYALHSLLGFWGMLSVLEMACRQTLARRVPAWVVLLICANPSALFWTTFNLKEGAMLWGLCMMLRGSLRSRSQALHEGLLLPVIGTLTAGFLRPHIAAAYLVALGVGVVVRQRRLALAILAVPAIVGALAALQTIAPSVFESFADDGIGTTLAERYQQLNTLGGSAITYSRGAPIPFVSGFVLLTLRPLPYEVTDITTMCAGAEIWLISAATLWGWYRLPERLRFATSAFAMTSIATIVFISFYFSYMYNMGLMVRQRLMTFPVLLSLAVIPALALANAVRIRGASPTAFAVGPPRPHFLRRDPAVPRPGGPPARQPQSTPGTPPTMSTAPLAPHGHV